MDKERLTLEIPYGMRDFLPTEAAEKRAIEAELAALFAEWGYDEVVTPTIEYLDNLTLGSSHISSSSSTRTTARSRCAMR